MWMLHSSRGFQCWSAGCISAGHVGLVSSCWNTETWQPVSETDHTWGKARPVLQLAAALDFLSDGSYRKSKTGRRRRYSQVILLSKKQHNIGTEQEKRKWKSGNNCPSKVLRPMEMASGISDFSLLSLDSCLLKLKVILIPCVHSLPSNRHHQCLTGGCILTLFQM